MKREKIKSAIMFFVGVGIIFLAEYLQEKFAPGHNLSSVGFFIFILGIVGIFLMMGAIVHFFASESNIKKTTRQYLEEDLASAKKYLERPHSPGKLSGYYEMRVDELEKRLRISKK